MSTRAAERASLRTLRYATESGLILSLGDSKPYQLIPKRKPRWHSVVPPNAHVRERTMRRWEKRVHRKYPEEKVVVHSILDRWIALFMKGHPVPKPKTNWEHITQEGFAIFLSAMAEAGFLF